MKKENANTSLPGNKKPSQEKLFVEDAGKVGASMVHISLSAAKLFARMIKVAFRASKLIIDYTLKATHKQDNRQAAK